MHKSLYVIKYKHPFKLTTCCVKINGSSRPSFRLSVSDFLINSFANAIESDVLFYRLNNLATILTNVDLLHCKHNL